MATHLVTGAGSGIGAALAVQLSGRGDEVIAIARSQERADALSRRLNGSTVLVADLADLADPGSLGDLQLPDRLDSVVHSAGVVRLGRVAELSADDWTSQLAVNLVAPALLTRRALPALRRARGTVVFVNSGAGLSAAADWSAYGASKSGLRSLADALRAEEAASGVRVSVVYPGRTATPMQEDVHRQEGKEYDPTHWTSPETVADAIRQVLDLPADATISELVLRPR
jgi:short-subunit dehydrogenase